ncbi:MAG: hypothetical protein GY861_18600 [bacterium]|nr:hypothetical protein [bacterium]
MNSNDALDLIKDGEKQLQDHQRFLTEANTKYRLALIEESKRKIELAGTQGDEESESAFEKRMRKMTLRERRVVETRKVDLNHAIRMYQVFVERLNLAKILLRLEEQQINTQT